MQDSKGEIVTVGLGTIALLERMLEDEVAHADRKGYIASRARTLLDHLRNAESVTITLKEDDPQ
jgi:hypothetical protein